jgi:ribonuclease HI
MSSNLSSSTISVFTDGACPSNGQKNAIAGVGVWFGNEDPRNISERLPPGPQTNNRAELWAVIRALQSIPPNERVEIYTDSTYVMNGTHSNQSCS